nr:hypothetical protein [Tanacetum cinerariifolium]
RFVRSSVPVLDRQVLVEILHRSLFILGLNFNKQKPHSFEKATAPVDAENWISHMEKIFDVIAASTAEEQAKNFQWGLRKSTLNHLMCILFMDVAQVANAARNYEILHERDDDGSRGPSEGYSYPVCTTCGRRHLGECLRAAGTCFKCGQTGHLQKDCKNNTAASTSGQVDKKPGASGRVFAITEDHATK